MKNACRIAALTLMTSLVALAGDLTITFNAKAKTLLGTNSGTEIQYYSATHMLSRNESTKQDALVDYVKGVSYTIDHKKKVVEMLSFDDALAALQGLDQALPKEASGMMGAMFGDPNDVSVDDSGAETVAGRTCIKYKIRVAKLNMEVSADPKLKPPFSAEIWAKAQRARAAQMAKAGPMGATFKRLFDEMSKIQGIPLKTRMSGFMGMDTQTEATSVVEGPVPAALFVLPAGYKVEDMGKKLKEELAKSAR
jgi:hypothetical protein